MSWTSQTITELDPATGLVRLTSPPGLPTTVVRVDTGEAVARVSEATPWAPATSRFDPLLPTPIVWPPLVATLLSLDSGSDVTGCAWHNL